jgi:hypothetical protein
MLLRSFMLGENRRNKSDILLKNVNKICVCVYIYIYIYIYIYSFSSGFLKLQYITF